MSAPSTRQMFQVLRQWLKATYPDATPVSLKIKLAVGHPISMPLDVPQGHGSFVADGPGDLNDFQLRVLEVLASGKALSMDALASKMDCDRGSLHRSGLRKLLDAGLVANDRDKGGYIITEDGAAMVE